MSLKQPLMTRCGHAIAYFKVEFITIHIYPTDYLSIAKCSLAELPFWYFLLHVVGSFETNLIAAVTICAHLTVSANTFTLQIVHNCVSYKNTLTF
jgi:hypothetical protein